MWAPIWPGTSIESVPVQAITNGVHAATWVSAEMAQLFDRHLGPDWLDRQDDPSLWDRVLDIPDDQLWQARETLRHYLFGFMRERARRLWTQEGVGPRRVVVAGTLLDSNVLTIGFARRFTAYKRPDLIFRDVERLARILTAPGRPVQIVFAGKSHPADDVGKHHMQRVYQRASDPTFAGRVAFVEDYDLHVAHFLVQGCDVWLNNPRKPMEASGTSGMKASINGVPHLSIGDGWWAEGFDGGNGWLIGGTAAGDEQALDAADADSLYGLLEEQIVPAFYERGPDRVPHRWLRIVKEAIRSVAPRFCARRMVKEYVERAYAPAARQQVVR
jgi:starch phosphorylase